jgi:hypothetical protein
MTTPQIQEPEFTPYTIEIVEAADLVGSGDGSLMCVMDADGSTYAACTVTRCRQARKQINAWSYDFPIVIADAYRRVEAHFARIRERKS